MPEVPLQRTDAIAYREARPERGDAPAAFFLHGAMVGGLGLVAPDADEAPAGVAPAGLRR